ncbi:hypothetical protein LEP1GSC021_3534 [Leptospira noguchii str. 1993005606]|nr:hypothetical protein LEP1GSC021_3534 [Leptospira noguchii str. 1993005606]
MVNCPTLTEPNSKLVQEYKKNRINVKNPNRNKTKKEYKRLNRFFTDNKLPTSQNDALLVYF